MKARPKSSVVEEFKLANMYVQLRFFEDNGGTNKPRWKISALCLKRIFFCHRREEVRAREIYHEIRGLMAAAAIDAGDKSQLKLTMYLAATSEGINFARTKR